MTPSTVQLRLPKRNLLCIFLSATYSKYYDHSTHVAEKRNTSSFWVITQQNRQCFSKKSSRYVTQFTVSRNVSYPPCFWRFRIFGIMCLWALFVLSQLGINQLQYRFRFCDYYYDVQKREIYWLLSIFDLICVVLLFRWCSPGAMWTSLWQRPPSRLKRLSDNKRLKWSHTCAISPDSLCLIPI